MAKVVKHSDIISDDLLDKTIKDATLLLGILRKLEDQFKSMIAASSGKAKETPLSGYDNIKKTVDEINKMKEAVNGLKTVEEKQTEAAKTLAEALELQRINTAKLNAEKKEEKRIIDMTVKAASNAEGSYNNLAAQYELNTLKLRKMTAAQIENTESGQKLQKETADMFEEMKRLDKLFGKNVLNVGNYAQAVEGVEMSLGEMKKELIALRNTSFVGKSDQEVAALKKRMGELTDEIGDARTELQMMGTENAAVVVGGLKLIAAGVEGVVGSLSLMGVESETIKNLESKMTSLIATTQALAEIEDTLSSGKARAMVLRFKDMAITEKDTIVKWLSVTATNAQARAEGARATMTTTASVATKAAAASTYVFNVALKALMGPIGGVIAGIGLAVAAYEALTDSSDEASESQKNLGTQTDSLTEKFNKQVQAIENVNKELKGFNQDSLQEATANYVKYRALYKAELLAYQKMQAGITQSTMIQRVEQMNITNAAYAKMIEWQDKMKEEQNKKLDKDLDNARQKQDDADKKAREKAIKEAEERRKKLDELAKKTAEQEIKYAEDEQARIEKLRQEQEDDAKKLAELAEEKRKARKAEVEALEKQLEEEKLAYEKAEKEKREREAKQINDAAELLDTYYAKRLEKQKETLDKEVEKSKEQQDYLKQLAAQGVENAAENLAFEQRKQAELEAKRQKLEQKQRMIEMQLTALKTYASKVEQGEPNAVGATIKDISMLKEFVKGLGSFYDGTEDTGQGGNIDNKKGFLSVLHPHERVLTADQNKLLSGISNWELANLGAMYKDGRIKESDSELIGEVRNLTKVIDSKPVYLGRDYNATEQAIIDVIQKGNKIERYHKKISSIF